MLRKTLTISVSDEMHSLICKGMRSRFYGTVSEYIRFLVRRDEAPAAVEQVNPIYDAPRTANQVSRTRWAMRKAERAVLGDK